MFAYKTRCGMMQHATTTYTVHRNNRAAYPAQRTTCKMLRRIEACSVVWIDSAGDRTGRLHALHVAWCMLQHVLYVARMFVFADRLS